MTSINTSYQHSFFTTTLLKRMLIGGAIGLTVMMIFLSGVDQPDPAWTKYWIIRPLIVITFAGAGGGAFFHLMNPIRLKGGWKKITAVFLSMLVFIFCLWIGSIMGLDGTLWD